MEFLTVRGASLHNLQRVDCRLPRQRLVVVTGPSGSGKSSLVFDTIFAEGQRRYVESLSAWARQSMGQLPKPAVDLIDGLSPAIAIEQRTLSRTPRSTVGTVTELGDYLRVLFARVGQPHCTECGRALRASTVQEMVDLALSRGEGARLVVLAPLLRGARGPLEEELERLRRQGFVRVRLNGAQHDLADAIAPGRGPHDLDVVIDRLAVRDSTRGRLTDSVELALRTAEGRVAFDFVDGSEPVTLSERLVCWEHGVTLPALEPSLFSFNGAGACPECAGLGERTALDPERVVPDPTRTLRDGAIHGFGMPGSVAAAAELSRLVDALGVDPDRPWGELPEADRHAILQGGPARKRGRAAPYPGVLARLQRLLEGDPEAEDDDTLEGALGADELAHLAVRAPCAGCGGLRLRREALAVRVAGRHLGDWSALSLEGLRAALAALLEPGALTGEQRGSAEPLVQALAERIGFLLEMGLSYLTLDRRSTTLSGGEAQRLRLATQLGASLVGVLYVLDEPSAGLHPKDHGRLLASLRRLADRGNSVLVVEHDRDALLAADYLVDMGPGAGALGGRIVAQGTPDEVRASRDSVTAPFLNGTRRVAPADTLRPRGPHALVVRGARAHNLANLTVEFPLGLLVAVTGVSGSGKSSLVVHTLLAAARSSLHGARTATASCDAVTGLDHLSRVISVDHAPLGRTPRSNAATYTGIAVDLRELFAALPEARARGYKAARFSFNVKGGRCEACRGDGVRRVALHLLPDVFTTCESCQGRRFNRETLEIRFRGLSIADVLDLTVDQARDLFDAVPRLRARLEALRQVGLGYLTLGQSATTLSGGEAQRVKLAAELGRSSSAPTLYVLDEPTTGLHFHDIELLLRALFALRDAGHTVIVIEHDLDLIASADWVIDLGPGGGPAGGHLAAQGTPLEVSQVETSHTGQALAEAHRTGALLLQRHARPPARAPRTR